MCSDTERDDFCAESTTDMLSDRGHLAVIATGGSPDYSIGDGASTGGLMQRALVGQGRKVEQLKATLQSVTAERDDLRQQVMTEA